MNIDGRVRNSIQRIGHAIARDLEIAVRAVSVLHIESMLRRVRRYLYPYWILISPHEKSVKGDGVRVEIEDEKLGEDIVWLVRSWHDAASRRTPEIIRRSRGVRSNRMLLPRITTKLRVTRPRHPVPTISALQRQHYISFNIGRKHKAHRQQLAQDKPWRESEKGRGKGKGKGRRSKMGNEESRVVDADTPPQTLKARTVEALAQYIKDGRAKQIVVMVNTAL
jgi:hypothetical protein